MFSNLKLQFVHFLEPFVPGPFPNSSRTSPRLPPAVPKPVDHKVFEIPYFLPGGPCVTISGKLISPLIFVFYSLFLNFFMVLEFSFSSKSRGCLVQKHWHSGFFEHRSKNEAWFILKVLSSCSLSILHVSRYGGGLWWTTLKQGQNRETFRARHRRQTKKLNF